MRAFVLTLLLAGCSTELPALKVGETMRGALTQHDEQVGDGSLVDRYRLSIPTGRVIIVLRSEDFAPSAAASVSGSTASEILTSDQTEGVGCLAIESAITTQLDVAVSSMYGLEVGRYSVTVKDEGPLPVGCRLNRLSIDDVDTA